MSECLQVCAISHEGCSLSHYTNPNVCTCAKMHGVNGKECRRRKRGGGFVDAGQSGETGERREMGQGQLDEVEGK